MEGAGRARLNRSPDVRDLRKSRDSVLKFRKPSGSKPGISKVHVLSPLLFVLCNDGMLLHVVGVTVFRQQA